MTLFLIGIFLLLSPISQGANGTLASRQIPLGPDLGDTLYPRLSHRADVWYGSTYWTGPDWTRVGKDWHHPGELTPSVRCFASPQSGRIFVTGEVYKADTQGGDGVRLFILHNDATIWQAEIEGNDGHGLCPTLSLDVLQGDRIRFVVHKRSAILCDTTHWDPVITYDSGERFQASAGFSTSTQGEKGWFYEMESGLSSGSPSPVLRWFKEGLRLEEKALTNGEMTSIDLSRDLPLLVLSARGDQGGVAMAWDPQTVSIAEISLLSGHLAQVSVEPQIQISFSGSWSRGMQDLFHRVQTAAEGPNDLTSLSERIEREMSEHLRDPMDLTLWALVQQDWMKEDRLPGAKGECLSAAQAHLEKTNSLLVDLSGLLPEEQLHAEALELSGIREALKRTAISDKEAMDLYGQVRSLKRSLALKNPLLRSHPLFFCKRRPTSYSHLVMQYFGWRARPGGGLFVLDNPGFSLEASDILKGQLSEGNVLEPRLSYDGQRIVFSYVKCLKEPHIDGLANDQDEGFYHIFEVQTDGSGFRQLTQGPFEDLMPAYLPDGGIVFSSTRRKGYARCFGGQFSRRWHVYTLHRMDADGNRIQCLSFHDTNEWFPSVSRSGDILYSRWDYIDRDAVTHQTLWATRPDGSDPRVVWGNATPSPHCTFQAQPIPGSGEIVFTASAHHSITAGSIVVLDPSVARDGHTALKRLTPDVPFPEAESMDIREYYEAPWPLSSTYFLVAYSPFPLVWEPGANQDQALGLYLLDSFGNRELLFRDPEYGCTTPCPLSPRAKPPILSSPLQEAGDTGVVFLMDVTRGLGNVPQGAIKRLRVIQILPKSTHVANSPPVGLATEENARAVLGSVEVAEDGSALFKVPAGKPILFQALDEEGFAFQTMRSVTYVHPGERVSCVGCHEIPMSAPPLGARSHPRMQDIVAGPGEGEPFSFMRSVQPVLNRRCIRCHGEASPAKGPPKGVDLTAAMERGFTRSYTTLLGDRDFSGPGTNLENASSAWIPRFGMRNQIQVTPPGGLYGARGSRLLQMLKRGHQDVQLTPEELQALGTWIDCNAIFYGVNAPEGQARQLAGELLPMPDLQ